MTLCEDKAWEQIRVAQKISLLHPKEKSRKVLTTQAGGLGDKSRLYNNTEATWIKDWLLNGWTNLSHFHFQTTGRNAVWPSPLPKNLNDFSWKGKTPMDTTRLSVLQYLLKFSAHVFTSYHAYSSTHSLDLTLSFMENKGKKWQKKAVPTSFKHHTSPITCITSHLRKINSTRESLRNILPI